MLDLDINKHENVLILSSEKKHFAINLSEKSFITPIIKIILKLFLFENSKLFARVKNNILLKISEF